jgi:hypothetical protein
MTKSERKAVEGTVNKWLKVIELAKQGDQLQAIKEARVFCDMCGLYWPTCQSCPLVVRGLKCWNWSEWRSAMRYESSEAMLVSLANLVILRCRAILDEE